MAAPEAERGITGGGGDEGGGNGGSGNGGGRTKIDRASCGQGFYNGPTLKEMPK